MNESLSPIYGVLVDLTNKTTLQLEPTVENAFQFVYENTHVELKTVHHLKGMALVSEWRAAAPFHS